VTQRFEWALGGDGVLPFAGQIRACARDPTAEGAHCVLFTSTSRPGELRDTRPLVPNTSLDKTFSGTGVTTHSPGCREPRTMPMPHDFQLHIVLWAGAVIFGLYVFVAGFSVFPQPI